MTWCKAAKVEFQHVCQHHDILLQTRKTFCVMTPVDHFTATCHILKFLDSWRHHAYFSWKTHQQGLAVLLSQCVAAPQRNCPFSSSLIVSQMNVLLSADHLGNWFEVFFDQYISHYISVHPNLVFNNYPRHKDLSKLVLAGTCLHYTDSETWSDRV